MYPKSEIYGLTSQMRRSAVSVAANIAEGYGRHSTQDYIRFLRISRGSLFELQTLLDISENLKLIKNDQYNLLYELSFEIEKMLNTLISKLGKKS